MCSPVAFTAGSAALSLVSAQQQHKAQLASAKDAAAFANVNALRQYTALQARQEQERARAAESIRRNAEAARKAQSTAVVAAGESGAQGNSAAALLGEFERTATEYEGAVVRNQAFLDAEFKAKGEAVQAQQQAEITAAYNQVQEPNYLGILVKGFGDFLEIEQKQPKPEGQ